MTIVNMHQAKTNLSVLVDEIESGSEREIIIARNGVPAVRIVPLAAVERTAHRIGIAAGKYRLPETFDANNDAIADLFDGKEVSV